MVAPPNSSDDDDVLLAGVEQRDIEALSVLYERHGLPVFRIASHVLDDDSLAEDTTVRVFVRLWRSPRRHDQDDVSLRAFLVMQSYDRALHPTETDDQDTDRPVGEAEAAVAALSLEERKSLELTHFGSLTAEETARELEIAPEEVRRHLRSGLLRLKEVLSSPTDPED